jgi:hypothetical protein
MAKKSMISEATDAVKSVAGAALGAAAVAATGLVVARVAGAITESGQQLEKSAPQIQKLAEDTVTKPLLPTRQKRAAAKRSAASAKKRVAAKKAVKKPVKKVASKKAARKKR